MDPGNMMGWNVLFTSLKPCGLPLESNQAPTMLLNLLIRVRFVPRGALGWETETKFEPLSTNPSALCVVVSKKFPIIVPALLRSLNAVELECGAVNKLTPPLEK